MEEKNVSFKRISKTNAVTALDNRHIYTVYIRPKKFKSLLQEVQESSTGPPQKTVFALNDRVEAKYAGRSRWYRGRIIVGLLYMGVCKDVRIKIILPFIRVVVRMRKSNKFISYMINYCTTKDVHSSII